MTEQDLQQLQKLGITPEQVDTQLEHFKKGFPCADVVAAATVGEGILKFSDEEVAQYGAQYDEACASKDVVKFVPASGAASRMFKGLFDFCDAASHDHDCVEMLKNYQEFAFGDKIDQMFKEKGIVFDHTNLDLLVGKVCFILHEEGLNYGNMPKGMVLFHKYEDGARTAFEEHLVEGAMYAKSGDRVVLHFTVSPAHEWLISKHLNTVLPKYEKKFGVKFEISFSTQKESTNTIAVNMDNTPFRCDDGSILFRPAGHGALIANLNEIDADVVFIKNIDNVVPDRLKDFSYKKALAGYLLSVQETMFGLLKRIKEGDETAVEEAVEFCEDTLKLTAPAEGRKEFVIEALDRPLRVCGMVKNEGEPGGGPFWVKDAEGEVRLQIVEASQIDTAQDEYREILEGATHFNPVDLVCGTRNFKGEAFDLMKYVDPESGFISNKSKNGKELKAQELPGLWNGAMAEWNTFFVEVPAGTFNPVKTVGDLLRDSHRG